ncbi:MAG TPA: hypothetical protein VMD92_00945 [Acidobacteriaceae bacterium]|nr:hypothetical protein [Acidobacteriaceae bacterium]
MKRIAWFASFAGLGIYLCAPAWLAAQSAESAHVDHGEVGVYGDYLRFTPDHSTVNFVGVGALAGVNVAPHVSLEGTMSYDFARNYTTTYSSTGSGGITTNFVTTRERPLTGLFGPKLETGGSMRFFVTAKAGFIDFSQSNNPNVVSSGTFSGAVNGVGGTGTHVAFYPGGGIESFWGPFGLRLEAGDEVFLNNGAYNNLRIAFEPMLRF